MNKSIWLLSALISSAMFLFSCSSDSPNSPPCDCDSKSSSSSGGNPSSSSLTPSSSSGNTVQDHDLGRKNITLSSEKNYADIDTNEPTIYTKDDVANNLNKIDLVAYCGDGMGLCEHNSIYDPYKITLFWNRGEYVGGWVGLYEVPAAQAEIFKTAIKYSEIYSTLLNLVTTFNGTPGADEISIVEGKVFLVYTTEENSIRIIIIKNFDSQSVNLEVITP